MHQTDKFIYKIKAYCLEVSSSSGFFMKSGGFKIRSLKLICHFKVTILPYFISIGNLHMVLGRRFHVGVLRCWNRSGCKLFFYMSVPFLPTWGHAVVQQVGIVRRRDLRSWPCYIRETHLCLSHEIIATCRLPNINFSGKRFHIRSQD